MIEVVWKFWSLNVRRNLNRVLATTHPYLSGLIALAVSYDLAGAEYKFKVSPIVNTFVTYDTVVFGFTATAIALAIAIPSPTFIKFLSGLKDKTTPFRDFLFILAWNGFVHISAFFVSIPLIIIGQELSFDDAMSSGAKFYFFVFLWFQIYASFQFMVTTLAVFELGDLYARYVAKERKDEEAKEEAEPTTSASSPSKSAKRNDRGRR